MMRKTQKLRIGAGTNRCKIEQLEALLQQKRKQLAKLKRIHRVLSQREQVVSRCIHQQVDLLEVLGQLVFSLPDVGDAEYESKATAAVEALLKDMEVAQLMQAAESFSATHTTDCESTQQQQQPQQQQQAQQQEPEPAAEQEPFTFMVLRSFLCSPDCMQTMRRLSSASVQDLAGIIRDQVMQLGFAVARYPSLTYVDAAQLAATKDDAERKCMQEANTRLQDALNALGRTILLLHIVRDKVLNMSMLNLETLQPETPPASFWEEVASKLQVPLQHMAQLHTGFLLYSSKRSELTAQMQQTMQKLQQLLAPLMQQQQPAAPAAMLRSSSDSCSGLTHNTSWAANSGTLHEGYQASPDMLESMEDADRLLAELNRQVWLLREASRCLIFHYSNVLDPLQMSLSCINSWPFIMQPPPIVEVLVKQQVQRQQLEDSQDEEQ